MLLHIYNKIGPSGVVLIVLSFLSLYLAVKNIFLLSLINRDFYKRFANIESGEQAYAAELHNPQNPLIEIIAEVVKNHAKHSHDIRAEVAYLFHRNLVQINRDIAWLKLISVIAPLLGLLGTMLGMIAVFRELAGGAGGANASILANGIWEALITTIMGLCVAVPTLVAFYFLSLKMKGFHIEAIEHSYRALDLFKRFCPFAKSLELERETVSNYFATLQDSQKKSCSEPAHGGPSEHAHGHASAEHASTGGGCPVTGLSAKGQGANGKEQSANGKKQGASRQDEKLNACPVTSRSSVPQSLTK